jgi:hypothetical protein
LEEVMTTPKLGDAVVDARDLGREVAGWITLIEDKGGRLPFVMIDWDRDYGRDPELVTLRPSDWSKVRSAWVLSRVPSQDDLCFDPVTKQIGRVWGVLDDEDRAFVIWAPDLGTLTSIFVEEMERADRLDTDESTKSVPVGFDDMAYSEAGRFWNVLVHQGDAK